MVGALALDGGWEAARRFVEETFSEEVEELDDGLVIPGRWAHRAPPDDEVFVDSHDDHRIAMSFANAGIPVTLIEAGPCRITQLKSTSTDGYNAVQVGFGAKKPKNTPLPMQGHFRKAGTDPLRTVVECRMDEGHEYALGDLVGISVLSEAAAVIEPHPAALQLRYLQALTEIAAENNSTTVFPIPMELFGAIAKGSQGSLTPEEIKELESEAGC